MDTPRYEIKNCAGCGERFQIVNDDDSLCSFCQLEDDVQAEMDRDRE